VCSSDLRPFYRENGCHPRRRNILSAVDDAPLGIGEVFNEERAQGAGAGWASRDVGSGLARVL